jgi:23S rRNA pseudouridine2457 synthase
MLRYFVIYKPFNMLSQFTPEGEHLTLKDLDFTFPKDVYPVGRLDADSEGLLLLTNDTAINKQLLDPKNQHPRTYLVQVEGAIDTKAIKMLESGLEINNNGKIYKTQPAKAKIIDIEPLLTPRVPPVRFRKTVPTSWIELTLIEGKNRQVRKMTAKAGFPTLRLLRIAIGNIRLDNMQPGEVKEIDKETVYKILSNKLGTALLKGKDMRLNSFFRKT